MEFYAPRAKGTAEITEKRSRFIGYAAPVSDERSASEFVARIKTAHHDARHNAWCRILPDGAERASDDGEPQGTAGAPMLEMLRRENIRGIAVVVARYFGGVLLGPGGLARAYTAAAKAAVLAAEPVPFVTKRRVAVRVTYAAQAKIKSEIALSGGEIESARYESDVELLAVMYGEKVADFLARVRDATSGGAEVQDLGDIIVPF